MDQKITLKFLAKMIDHSLLHPTMTDAEIIFGCETAKKYDVATVCVKPYAVEMCKNYLEGTDVRVCSVVTFPHGNSTTKMKVKARRPSKLFKHSSLTFDLVNAVYPFCFACLLFYS